MYKAGVENKVANAISRQFEDAEVRTIISYPTWQQGSEINEVRSDPKLKSIIEDLQKDPKAKTGYSLHGGRLFYKNRLVISASSPLIPLLLEEFHSIP